MGKISSYSLNTNPSTGDYLLGETASGPSTNRFQISDLIAAIFGNSASTQGAWSSWTPTWTNLTLGSGTVVARYVQMGKTVSFQLSLAFGSGTSVSGNIIFSLPVASNSTTYPIGGNIDNVIGSGFLRASIVVPLHPSIDATGASNSAASILYSTSSTSMSHLANGSATYNTSSCIQVSGRYEAA